MESITKKYNKIRELFRLSVFTFMTYSIIGWSYEVLLGVIVNGEKFENKGFLYGPYLPIYGFGSLFILYVFYRFKDKKIIVKDKNIMPIIMFVGIMVIVSVLEYATSFILEAIFNKVMWDYSMFPFNLNGRICIYGSIVFGIFGLLEIYVFQPMVEKRYNKLMYIVKDINSVIMPSIIITDFIFTIISYIK